MCTAPPVKVEPNEWADAVAASAEHHLRELSLENKQLKRHQRRTASAGGALLPCCCGGRCMCSMRGRGGKSVAAWYVFSQNTQPSTKQKRVRAARLALESRAGAVLDGVHAHYRSKLVKGVCEGAFVRTVLGVGKGLPPRAGLCVVRVSCIWLDVLAGFCFISSSSGGPWPTSPRGGGQGGRAAVHVVARVLDCMGTSNGLAKVGLSRSSSGTGRAF